MRIVVRYRYIRRQLNILHHNISTYYYSIALFIAITGLLIVFLDAYKSHNIWGGWEAAFGNAYSFCELDRGPCSVRQPINTWSNLGFLIVGLISLTFGINDFRRRKINTQSLIVKYPAFSIMMGISCIYVFFGSFFYHASLTYFFQKMDITGIYALMISILAYNTYVLFPKYKFKAKERDSHHVIIPAAILIFLLFYFYVWKLNINYLFPLIVFITFVLKYMIIRSGAHAKAFLRYLGIGLVSIVLAGAMWILDFTDLLCSPYSVLQGHAVWHILCAISALFIYFYYRSDLSIQLVTPLESSDKRTEEH
ncbi:MAG: hypothetical protein HKN92_11195 [Chitinophagales bacterium]|nr:hypothetical protein [Chitinophagales bacterium]